MARVRLAGTSEVQTFRSSQLERFTGLEHYWMKREGILFHPFDPQRDAYFIPKEAQADREVATPPSVENELLLEEEYTTTILMAKHAMGQGELDKVVLARNEHSPGTVDADTVFERALERYPGAYCFQVDLGVEQWVGASPELLLHYEDGTLHTVALAGTKLKGEEFGAKEREEQEMVEAFIEERLAALGFTEVEKSGKREVEFDQLLHLRTDYRVACDAELAMRAVEALHPTSAVCGMPRDASFAFITDFETMDRGFYSGFTGLLEKTRATFFVNLRCLRVRDGQAELFAGAGITAESDAQSEWSETQRKIESIRKLLD